MGPLFVCLVNIFYLSVYILAAHYLPEKLVVLPKWAALLLSMGASIVTLVGLVWVTKVFFGKLENGSRTIIIESVKSNDESLMSSYVGIFIALLLSSPSFAKTSVVVPLSVIVIYGILMFYSETWYSSLPIRMAGYHIYEIQNRNITYILLSHEEIKVIKSLTRCSFLGSKICLGGRENENCTKQPQDNLYCCIKQKGKVWEWEGPPTTRKS